MAWLRPSIVLLTLLALGAPVARAEPLLVSVEGTAGFALSKPQSNLFTPGVAAALGLYYPVLPVLLIGGRFRAGFLGNGPAPSNARLADPGVGTLVTASLVLRVRPFAASEGVRRAKGLFFDLAGGGALTGNLTRGTFEAGVGYGMGVGTIAIAPVLRYVQVVQPTAQLSSADAHLFMIGAELTFLDAEPAPPAQKLRAVVDEQEPTDTDGDGIADVHDVCADQPEDIDGFEDGDGCPDPDNDNDKIPDVVDKCPDSAEDFDEYEDTDGCPDPDNDHDGFLDADDQCPNEAEIVNGNKDFDGCPDEGLIEFKNDRIVLEERVLFDFERARVKREARPILRAIATLKSQHPEWIKLRIEGHADARGDAHFNQEVSEYRANNVMRELIKMGIPASQIEAVGYGSTRLRDKRTDEESNARNRRVEFVVIARGVAAPGTISAPRPSAADDAVDDDLPEVPRPSAGTPSAPSPAAAPAKPAAGTPPKQVKKP